MVKGDLGVVQRQFKLRGHLSHGGSSFGRPAALSQARGLIHVAVEETLLALLRQGLPYRRSSWSLLDIFRRLVFLNIGGYFMAVTLDLRSQFQWGWLGSLGNFTGHPLKVFYIEDEQFN